MEGHLDASLARRRFSTLLVSTFAAIAVLLAKVGVYGVMAYSAVQRTREIGIRMAPGAKPINILGLLMGYGMRVTLFGLAAGLVVALAATRLLSSLLYEVGALLDPGALAAAALVVAVSAMTASYVPSRRAMRSDPMAVLRKEG